MFARWGGRRRWFGASPCFVDGESDTLNQSRSAATISTRQRRYMGIASLLRGYFSRFLKLWVFWFWFAILDVIGLISTIFISFDPPRIWYFIMPAIGFVVANIKLYADDQAEINKYRAQEGVPSSAALALESDRQAYARLRSTMQIGDTETFLRETNLCGSFETRRLEGMDTLLRLGGSLDVEFIDSELESLRKTMENDMWKLSRLIATQTSPISGDAGWNRIHDPYAGVFDFSFRGGDEAQLHEQAWEKGMEMNEIATHICETYDELIRLCRRRLGV